MRVILTLDAILGKYLAISDFKKSVSSALSSTPVGPANNSDYKNETLSIEVYSKNTKYDAILPPPIIIQ